MANSASVEVVASPVNDPINDPAVTDPPTYRSPPIPTPPSTINAPVSVDIEFVTVVINSVPVTVLTPTKVALVIVLDQILTPSVYPTNNCPLLNGNPRSGSA